MSAGTDRPDTRRKNMFPDGEPLRIVVPAPMASAATFASFALVIGAAVLAAGLFLPHQSLWIDETTQLSGLTLSPAGVVRWLTHPATHDFGVPGDRMPPLSYWLGWLWARAFGLTETSLRWFGIACTAVAVGLVTAAGRRAFGARAGLFAGLFVALSPNVCVSAVEIRAYPLFLLTTAGALHALISIVTSSVPVTARRPWLVLAAWLLAGMYTHFYGALFASVAWVALVLALARARRPVLPAFLLGPALALGLLGLGPFVAASVGLSAATTRDRAHEVLQLVYRLIGHPAMAVFPLVSGLAFVAAALMAAVAATRPSRAPGATFTLLAFILGTGVAVSAVANFVVGGFTAAKVSYATWALPVVGLALGASVAASSRTWSRVALLAALVLCACEGIAIAELARAGDHFSHGPQRYVQRVLDRLEACRPAIVHVDSPEDYAAIYFPLRFVDGPGLRQLVVATPGRSTPPLGLPMLVAGSPASAPALRDQSCLVIVRSRAQNARQLADQLHHGDRAFGESDFITALESSGEWRLREHGLFVAFMAADVTVLERAPTPASTH